MITRWEAVAGADCAAHNKTDRETAASTRTRETNFIARTSLDASDILLLQLRKSWRERISEKRRGKRIQSRLRIAPSIPHVCPAWVAKKMRNSRIRGMVSSSAPKYRHNATP